MLAQRPMAISREQYLRALKLGKPVQGQMLATVHANVRSIPRPGPAAAGYRVLSANASDHCGEALDHMFAFAVKEHSNGEFYHTNEGGYGEENILDVATGLSGILVPTRDDEIRQAVIAKKISCVGVITGKSRAGNHSNRANMPLSVAVYIGGTVMVVLASEFEVFSFGDEVGFDWYTMYTDNASGSLDGEREWYIPPLINITKRMSEYKRLVRNTQTALDALPGTAPPEQFNELNDRLASLNKDEQSGKYHCQKIGTITVADDPMRLAQIKLDL